MSRSSRAVTVSVEAEIAPQAAARYFQLYKDTFGELATRAAARQLLHEHEFLAEMRDPRVDKLIASTSSGEVVGLSTLTRHLETVPWISPEYFAHCYPEHAARGAIYYLGFTLVHRDYRRGHVFSAMLERVVDILVEHRAVCGWDLCSYNDEDQQLGPGIEKFLTSRSDVTVARADRQVYFTGVFRGPRAD